MTMRFMMLVKASKDSETGVMPSEQELAAMGEYNEELTPELREQEERYREQAAKN
jgi:hypothetical protein